MNHNFKILEYYNKFTKFSKGVKIEKDTIYNNSYNIILWANNIFGIDFKCDE